MFKNKKKNYGNGAQIRRHPPPQEKFHNFFFWTLPLFKTVEAETATLKWTSEQNIILGWLLMPHANTSLFVLLLFVYSLWMDTNDVSRFFETLRMLAGAELQSSQGCTGPCYPLVKT